MSVANPKEEAAAGGNHLSQAAPVVPAGNGPESWIFPTSFAQRRLWFIDQLEPGNTLYNVPAAYRVRGRLDPRTLERAFSQVIARHEILRTTFRPVDGEPMQMVASNLEFHLPVVDLRAQSAAMREAEVTRLVREESEHPFNLANGPLMRAALLEMAPAEQVLILGLHHIITDSWSQEVLLRELTTAYSALAKDVPSPLPELPIQYADFAAWQREAMQGEVLNRELAYWRKRLAGLTPLDLPHLPRRAPSHPPEGATFSFELPERLTAAVRLLAQRENVTLFMALLAGWKAFLARYTGQEDIAVGSPISDRGRTETEGLIGFFLNTLVLRTDLSGNPTAREALRRVRDSSLDAFAHQNLPFDMMIEELQPTREPGRNPLLRVMFVLVSGEEKTWRTPDGGVEPIPVEESKAKFELMLHLRDVGGAVKAALVYDKALFNPVMVRRIAGHYETLLAGMAAQPDTRINSLPLVLPRERDRILRNWSGAAAPYPADRTVHTLFREQARLNPAAVAIEEGTHRMTYGDLDRLSDGVAAQLIRNGVKPGDPVAIGLPRSARLIVGILGILKAGASYVPLDPSYPKPRIDVMLRESGAKVLIGEGAPPAIGGGVSWFSIDFASPSEPPPPNLGMPGDVAYVMFTSGSTGVPKGVRVVHRGISRLVINTNYIEFTPGDAVAHASNTSFDASTFEIWGALLHGARLVIVPRETLLSPRELAAFLRERQISILFLTTPLFHHLAREIPGAFGSLRYLVAGGDSLHPEAARAVLHAARPLHLVNGYGPTEATTFAVCHEVNDVPPDSTAIPIGRPISNTRAYILDRALEPVPAGIAGELYLGGPGIAAGYLNDQEATAASFIADPFDSTGRLYKTGDLARWLDDGVIEFLGRADNQVKIRGFRVEPGEIETALARHPRVRQAVVIARPDSTGQKQLAAYVVPQPGPPPASSELREHLLSSLPEYMVPAAFAFLDTLPLNANGKVDHAALAAAPLVEPDREPETPGTWMEASLIEIWEELLSRRPIGVTDDFFDLGGHSLLAIRMLSQVEKVTGIKIPPRVLFEDATIRHLAAAARRPEAITSSAMVPVQSEGALPPLFFLHGDFVEGGLYCVKMARSIGVDRPFFAIDPHGVHDKPPHSIEEMAAARVELVRQVRPHGPYLLGGFCNGGLVAFEMARQLEAAGESVSSLVLLSVDGSNTEFSWLKRLIGLLPGDDPRRTRSFLKWRERILFARAAWSRQLDAAATPASASEQPRRIVRKAARIVRKAFGLMLPRPAPAASDMDTLQPEAAGVDIGQIYHEACAAYVPRPYRGPAHLLWPGEMPMLDPSAGWSSVMPQLKIIQVPGGHFSSLQGGNLPVVSERIRECLLEDHA
ncbi:MAG: amino acid adenylation domain-containing protein [Chthoniobacteraceae bacterium]